LSVQIWVTKLGPTLSMNFFNSVAMYAFVFLFPVVLMEPKKMLLVGHDSMTFISGQRVTLFHPSIQMVAP
jgi:hypothetical protein